MLESICYHSSPSQLFQNTGGSHHLKLYDRNAVAKKKWKKKYLRECKPRFVKKKGIIPGSLPLLRYLAQKTGKMLIMSFCEAWTLTAESWMTEKWTFQITKNVEILMRETPFLRDGGAKTPQISYWKKVCLFFSYFWRKKKHEKTGANGVWVTQ